MIHKTAFYRLSHDSFHTRKFAWAFRIQPQSLIEHMRCPECGAETSIPSGAFDVAVEGGSEYPDVLGCGAYPFLIVSDRVVEAWLSANITAFRTFSVGVFEVHSQALIGVEPPRYSRVEIDGRARVDLAASGVNVVRSCSRCGRVVERPAYPYDPKYQMVPGSWDGGDLFRDLTTYPRVSFCTEKVKELLKLNGITNILFEYMGKLDVPSVHGRSAGSSAID